MKKIVVALASMLLISPAFAQMKSVAVGTQAPDKEVKMTDVSGKEISIKDAMKENGVLVMFSCNTCPYVIKNQARTKAICDYALAHKMGVIIINSNEAQRDEADSYKAMQEYAKKQGYDFYYALDNSSKVADAFGATHTPETFLIDASGKIVYKGAIDDNPSDADNVKHQYLKDAIDETVAGKSVTIKESRSIGCSIKRTT
jgi:peroxiredoxin